MVNLFGSIGSALIAIYLGQQIVLERLPFLMETLHRLALAVMAALFMRNAFEEHGPWGAALSIACLMVFCLRAVTRNWHLRNFTRHEAARAAHRR